MSEICQWANCKEPLVYSGRGRRPDYCTPHKADAKKQQDTERKIAKKLEKALASGDSKCCIDARIAGVMSYGPKGMHAKKANVRKCEQCKTFKSFSKLMRKEDLVDRRSSTRTATSVSGVDDAPELGNASPDRNASIIAVFSAQGMGEKRTLHRVRIA